MDRFALNWPKLDASLLTDGQRCRIVWRSTREKPGGPGGSIDNNALCKKRLADGLDLTPGLLDELKSRGYANLAAEVEAMAGGSVDSAGAVKRWIAGLSGNGDWEEVGTRRGKCWVTLELPSGEHLELRPPPARGRSEWVLKCAPACRGRATFVAAASLKGIFSFLVKTCERCDSAAVERVLSAISDTDHPDVKRAEEAWRAR